MVEGTAKEKVEKNDKRSVINVFLEPQKIDTTSVLYHLFSIQLSCPLYPLYLIYPSYLFPTLLHPILDRYGHKNLINHTILRHGQIP